MLVIVLTGLYTTLGGMRAVAYNDAVQVVVLIVGSALLTVYGLNELGGWGELRRIVRLRHVQPLEAADPAGVEGTWAPVIETNATGKLITAGLVLQRQLPLARHAVLRADHRPLVLVHRPVHRAARARRAQRERRPPGSIFAAFLKLFPSYLFIIPGLICFALAKSGKIPELARMIGPDGKAIPAASHRPPSR